MHRLKSLGLIALALVAATALTAAPALAAGKPSAETKAATSVGESTATVHGTVNPNGVATKIHFEYGTTTSYGNSSPEVSIGSGTSNLEESRGLTALSANTTYHFRIVATNSNGTTDGSDFVFTTTPKPGLPEFVPGAGEAFPASFPSAKEGGEAKVNTKFSSFLECERSKTSGEISNAKNASLTDEMTGCRIGRFEPSCHTAGAKEGVVVITGTGNVAYISKATKKVALVFAINTGPILCGAVEEELKGSIIGPVTPINTKTTAYEMRWQGSGGRQEYMEYENEKGEKVEATFQFYANGTHERGALNVSGAIMLTMSKALTLSA